MAQVPLKQARAAYARRDWVVAREGFRAAAAEAPLAADDLAAMADCSWWLGDLDDSLPAQQEAYRLHLEVGRIADAALMALEIGYTLSLRAEHAQASGWMSRGVRHLAEEPEGPAHGVLAYIGFEESFHGGDLDTALERADKVHELGTRHGDPTLVALGVLGRGRVLVARGEVTRGMRLLDEAMVAAVSDDLDPAWAGNIYCHLMLACHDLADLRRAGEWTEATARWCERMPGAGPFMGICRVHRAQVLTARGDWTHAEREIAHVCEELASFDVEVVAEAHYQRGELRRHRGDLVGAEEALRAAHALGRDPQPALALLRLAQGRADAAAASLRTALEAARDPLARAKLLPTVVEAALATGDADTARAADEELRATAERYATAGLHASADHVHAEVALADGDVDAASVAARGSLRAWQELGVPHEVARLRLVLASACEALGDHDAAALEREAAADTLARLGAGSRPAPTAQGPAPGLTPRETEVLRLVATGRTNQQIATQLVLSVRTVERHLSTVYDKLGVRGRSARALAVSHAFREGLLPSDVPSTAGPDGAATDLRGDLRATTQVGDGRGP
jgi:ATP/maltotriose-dependent transcriptional regulator MalT